MISVRLLTQDEVAAQLQAEGCDPVRQQAIPEHSLWRTAYGQAFLVPEIGPDRMTAAPSLERIIASIRSNAPRPN